MNTIFEQMGGTYHEESGYLIPDLLPPAKNKSIGIWGQRHLRHIKKYRGGLYIGLQLSGKLNDYLTDIDQQAEDMFLRLVSQMAEREGVTEKLKIADQMEWAKRMNNIRNRAAEIVLNDLIYN